MPFLRHSISMRRPVNQTSAPHIIIKRVNADALSNCPDAAHHPLHIIRLDRQSVASVPLDQLGRAPFAVQLEQAAVVDEIPVLQAMHVQNRCRDQMLALGALFGPVWEEIHARVGIRHVARLGQLAALVEEDDGAGRGDEHGEAKVDARQRPLGLVEVLLRPQQVGGDDAALRKGQQPNPLAGAAVLVHGLFELPGNRRRRGCGVHLLVLGLPAQPPVKGRKLAKDGGDGLVRGRFGGGVGKDEAERVLEAGDDGPALDAEDLGVDAGAVEAQDAREAEVFAHRCGRWW